MLLRYRTGAQQMGHRRLALWRDAAVDRAGNAGADDDDHPLRRPKALQACAAYSSSALKRPRTRGPRDEVLHSASQLQSIFRLSMMRAAQAHS